MKRTIHQLKVLFKKNFLLQKRHPVITVIEFLVPALLSSLLLIGRIQVEPTKVDNVTRWDDFSVDPAQDVTYWQYQSHGLCNYVNGTTEPLLLIYSPDTNLTTDFMSSLKEIIVGGEASGESGMKNLGILSKACPFGHRDIELRGFNTSATMDKFMEDGGESSNVFYGIDFKNGEWFVPNNSTFPKTLDYALRPMATPRYEQNSGGGGRSGWLTNILYSRRPAQNGPTDKNSQYGGKPFYYQDLFVEMQHLIDYLYM